MTGRLSRRHVLAGLAAVTGTATQGHAQTGSRAPRIAVTDWAAAESLLAIGVAPIAVPDTAVYRQWLDEIPLPDTVVDLGSRTEPNLELLAALRPDRIIVSSWQRHLVGLFQRIAPTETITIVSGRKDAYGAARDTLAQVATMAGSPTAAAGYLAAFDDALSAFAARVTRRPLPPVYVAVLHENASQIFVYGPGSWVHEVLTRLGLQNALKRPTSAFGNALIDLAHLTETPDAVLLYLDQGERTRRAERSLTRSTLWAHLDLVRDGRVHRIPPFYALGGIPSAWRCARLLAATLADAPDRSHG